jgi:hypothetical protein
MTFVCSSTVAGWLWYCDIHDTHGNADSEEEAEVYADAHREHFADQQDDEPCDVVVWLRTPHERDKEAEVAP